MALAKIITKVDLGTWLQTDIDECNNCFLVVAKETSVQGDVIDSKNINNIVIELGVDSGVTNHPIPVRRISLSFNDASYNDEELDNKVVYAQLTNLPSSFYIKITSVDDGKVRYSSGKVALSVSTNGVKLQ